MVYILTNDYLAHHGIQGQKWGIRRYQNSDGSLTADGRKRYAKDARKELKRLDKAEVDAKYNINKYSDQYKKYSNKYDKTQDYKYKVKANDAKQNLKEYQKSQQKYKADSEKIVRDLIKNNFDVTMSDVYRSIKSDRGKRIAANTIGLLGSAALMLTPAPVVPIMTYTIRGKGTKYKVKDSVNGKKTGSVINKKRNMNPSIQTTNNIYLDK